MHNKVAVKSALLKGWEQYQRSIALTSNIVLGN